MLSNIAVIAAHPDDEVLGVGGTIARHCHMGDRVDILFLSDGVTGRDKHYDPKSRSKEIGARQQAAEVCGKLAGVKSIEFESYPNLRMDREPLLEVVQKIEDRLNRWQPEIVYAHHSSDTNIDHRVCFDATMVACRPTPENLVRSIRCFEVASSTEYSVPSLGASFVPNLYIDISRYLDRKLEMLAEYGAEMRAPPFPRSDKIIEMKAIVRGSEVGLNAAEAFMEVRRIEK